MMSPAMSRFIEAAQAHGFVVPHCAHCARTHFPPQSWCPWCLAPDIELKADSGRGRVLSTVVLHRSFDAAWNAKMPAFVACVLTASGLKVFAMADAALPIDTPVQLAIANGLLHAVRVE